MESAETLAGGYLAKQRSIDIGRCVSRGINVVTGNLGLVVGSAALAFVIIVGINLVPIAGWIAGFFIDPALAAGFYLILIKKLRGQDATVNDLFAPFSGSIVNLALAGVVSAALVAVGMLFLILPGIYLAVGYLFVIPLIADKKLEFWTAMELSRRVVHAHWFSAFALIIVATLVALLGLLAVLVGFIVTAPIAAAAIAAAYDDLFGEQTVAVVAAQ